MLDYIVAVDDGQGERPARPVPEFLWSELPKIVAAEECGDIGFAAFTRAGSRHAISAFLAASNSPSAKAAAFAGLAGQFLMDLHGDLEGAKASFAIAIERGNSEIRSLAMNSLGWALLAEGDTAGAHRAFEQAASENSAAAPGSRLGLGVISLRADDYLSAETAFRSALFLDAPSVRPAALSHLGIALHRQGKTDEAQTMYQAAVALDNADEKARALVNLGMLHHESSRLDAARRSYLAAVETAHSEFAPKALLMLGTIAFDVNDDEDAIVYLSQAIAANHRETAAVASFTIGRIRLRRNEPQMAGAAIAEAVEAGYLEIQPDHAAAVALLLQGLGRIDEALHCVEFLLESGTTQSDEGMLIPLAAKLADSGHCGSAEEVLWLATEASDCEVAEMAWQILTSSGSSAD